MQYQQEDYQMQPMLYLSNTARKDLSMECNMRNKFHSPEWNKMQYS